MLIRMNTVESYMMLDMLVREGVLIGMNTET